MRSWDCPRHRPTRHCPAALSRTFLPAWTRSWRWSVVPIRSHDVFVDIGSGMGRVVLLVHLLTGARAHGIEIQSRPVRLARRTVAQLGLTKVSFERADASDIQLEGTVFFVLTPHRRGLATSSDLAHDLSQRQPIVICAVGLVPRPRGVAFAPATRPCGSHLLRRRTNPAAERLVRDGEVLAKTQRQCRQ